MTPRKRASVIALHENTNFTQREISAKCKVSLSSVNRIIKLKNETGSVSPRRKGNCGGERATTPRDDAFLLRKSDVDPQKNSFDLQKDLAEAGVKIHDSTVRRRLLEAGRKSRRPVKKQLLIVTVMKKRLEWANKYKNWTKEDWRKVLFSDESQFYVQGIRVQHVRTANGEKISPKHIHQTVNHPQKKMFWGCFSYYGVGPLVPCDGMMNSDKYVPLLETRVLPELAKVQPDGSAVFQQDLARCHVSKKVTKFFKDTGIKVLDWPGNSPDMNPIENLWSICKDRLRKLDCTTKEKMISSLIQVWFRDAEINEKCKKLIDSMPNRLEQLIKAKGGHTKY